MNSTTVKQQSSLGRLNEIGSPLAALSPRVISSLTLLQLTLELTNPG